MKWPLVLLLSTFRHQDNARLEAFQYIQMIQGNYLFKIPTDQQKIKT